MAEKRTSPFLVNPLEKVQLEDFCMMQGWIPWNHSIEEIVTGPYFQKLISNKKLNLKSIFPNKISEYYKEFCILFSSFFNNDSFWLVAPYKVFDLGTERRIVNYKNKEALLITYTSGGTTPGDSYLWILDEKFFPTSYKMWTSIIPIGGVSATWSDWKKTDSGTLLPTKHILSLFGMEILMGTVKGYNL